MLLTEESLRKIIRESINRVLNETEWNYHYGKNHNGKPYMSDNKYNMMGRDTGHFGSGTYFSTYYYLKNNKLNDVYGAIDTPEFIQIDDGVYRVDIDLYKNLYRVYSTKQGQVLFSLLRTLNSMYNNIVGGNFNNSIRYQKARRNAEALGLKMPTYSELVRMIRGHEKSNNIQSFSTVYMEYNGYNGVNVSNIPEFDNTLHGSVIYDLSKMEGNVEQVNPKSLLFHKGSGSDIVITNPMEDDEINSMYSELTLSSIEKINSLTLEKSMRILKNNIENGRLISPYLLGKLNDKLLSHFLYYVYHKRDKYDNLIRMYWTHNYRDEQYFISIIEKSGAYYWVDYSNSIFEGLVDNFRYDLPYNISKEEEKEKIKEYVNKILGGKKPNNNMEEYINDIMNE